MVEVRLGDTVQCKYTGVKGVAMSKTEFINGCVQFAVAPKWNAKAPINPVEFTEVGVDVQSLKLIKKGERWTNPKKDAEMLDALSSDDTESTGGPMRRAPRMKGW